MRIATPVGAAPPMLSVFGPEHEDFRQRVRDVLAAFGPRDVESWEADGHIPRELIGALGAAGVFRTRWEAGRTGGLPHALVLAEEIVALSGGAGVAVTLHCEVFVGTLSALARCETGRSLLADALDGVVIGCFASTEDHGGSQVGAPRTTATPTAGGGWHVRGCKRYSSNAGRATHALLTARSAVHAPGRDVVLFAVPLDAPGVEVDGFFPKTTIRSCDLGRIQLDVSLPATALLGAPGTGLVHANRALQFERLCVAAQGVAAARSALGLAIAHCRDRRTGSDARLMDMQAIRHRLADAATELTAAETFVHAVVLGAMDGRNVAHESAALKLHCAHVAARVIDEAVQVLGARGMTANYPLERWWRDARVMRLGAGSDEMMREIVASGLDRRHAAHDESLRRLQIADEPLPAAPFAPEVSPPVHEKELLA
jgi:alkylation response protein AidB-like acyl-CoA dehydrogenase